MDANNRRILLLNPPHTAIGSRVPKEKLPPLGLLSIGGPLLDAGFPVELLDAEFGPMSTDEIVRRAASAAPRIVMIGHAGSSSAHPTVVLLARRIKAALPEATIVYGGVFPTYHWREILAAVPRDRRHRARRGRGRRRGWSLALAILAGSDPWRIAGIAFRSPRGPVATAPCRADRDLDDYRVGWELIDHRRYSYWGERNAPSWCSSRAAARTCAAIAASAASGRRWRHRDPGTLRARSWRACIASTASRSSTSPTRSRPSRAKAWRPSSRR